MNNDNDLTANNDYRDCHKNINKVLKYEHDVYGDNTLASFMWQIERDVLMKEIGLITKDKIRYLDFACGTGRIISFLEPYVDESTGVDISANMLSIAKTKTKKSLLLHCDLTKENIIETEKYNLITSFRFFLNAQQKLREEVMILLSEKLSNDGIFIFNNHGNTFSYYLLSVILGKLGVKKNKLNHMSYFETLKLIKNSNLQLERVYGIGFIPYSFYRWFKPLKSVFESIDNFISNTAFLKYFTSNLIFVCTKK